MGTILLVTLGCGIVHDFIQLGLKGFLQRDGSVHTLEALIRLQFQLVVPRLSAVWRCQRLRVFCRKFAAAHIIRSCPSTVCNAQGKAFRRPKLKGEDQWKAVGLPGEVLSAQVGVRLRRTCLRADPARALQVLHDRARHFALHRKSRDDRLRNDVPPETSRLLAHRIRSGLRSGRLPTLWKSRREPGSTS